MKPKEFLTTLAPTFCWCTAKDLYLMYEILMPDSNENSFCVVLSKYRDMFIRKVGDNTQKQLLNDPYYRTTRKNPYVYLRKE